MGDFFFYGDSLGRDPVEHLMIGMYIYCGFYFCLSDIVSDIKNREEGERMLALVIAYLRAHSQFAVESGTQEWDGHSNKLVGHILKNDGEQLERLFSFTTRPPEKKFESDGVVFSCGEASASGVKCDEVYPSEFDAFYGKVNRLILLTQEIIEALYHIKGVGLPEKTFELSCPVEAPKIDPKKGSSLAKKTPEPKKEGTQEKSEQDIKEDFRKVIEVTEHFDVSFDDVGGQEKAKQELRDVLYALKNPGIFEEYGIRGVAGILFYGPPGNGKTHLIKALANEVRYPFFRVQLSDIFIKWVGEPARNMRRTFEIAKENAPCILFFDEIDAIAARRDDSHESSKQVVATMLEQMNGLQSHKGVIVIGATNRRQDVDPAILRSGRFDKEISVDHLSREGKRDVFNIHVKKIEKRSKAKETIFDAIDWDAVLSEVRDHMSGAGIEDVISRAVRKKIKEALEMKKQTFPVTTEDLLFEIREYNKEKFSDSHKTIGFL